MVGDGCLMGRARDGNGHLIARRKRPLPATFRRTSTPTRRNVPGRPRAPASRTSISPRRRFVSAPSSRCVVDQLEALCRSERGQQGQSHSRTRSSAWIRESVRGGASRPVHRGWHGRQLRREVAVRRARQHFARTAAAGTATAAVLRHQGEDLPQSAQSPANLTTPFARRQRGHSANIRFEQMHSLRISRSSRICLRARDRLH